MDIATKSIFTTKTGELIYTKDVAVFQYLRESLHSGTYSDRDTYRTIVQDYAESVKV